MKAPLSALPEALLPDKRLEADTQSHPVSVDAVAFVWAVAVYRIEQGGPDAHVPAEEADQRFMALTLEPDVYTIDWRPYRKIWIYDFPLKWRPSFFRAVYEDVSPDPTVDVVSDSQS